jgi:hypothetical protein
VIANALENLIPGLAEQRGRERQNRALAFAGLTHTVCGREVLPLCPKHRLQLQLLRNAFTLYGTEPLAGDIFVFLWVLSPAYAQGYVGRQIVWNWLQWRLRRHVARLPLAEAKREVQVYLVDQLQDAPESSGDGTDYSPWIHWMAADAGFWLNVHGGFTMESYLNTPYLVLQQLRRMWHVNHPNMIRDSKGELQVEEPQFINHSDRLVGQWQRRHAEEISAIIRNQRERLPS